MIQVSMHALLGRRVIACLQVKHVSVCVSVSVNMLVVWI